MVSPTPSICYDHVDFLIVNIGTTFNMKKPKILIDKDQVTVEYEIKLSGSMLNMEENIAHALNKARALLMEEAKKRNEKNLAD